MKDNPLEQLRQDWMVKRFDSEEDYLLSEEGWHKKNKTHTKTRVVIEGGKKKILVFTSTLMHTLSELDLMGFCDVTDRDVTTDGDFPGKEWNLE